MMQGGARSVLVAVIAVGTVAGYGGTAVSERVLPVVAVSPAEPGPGGGDDESGGGAIVPEPVGRGSDDSEPAGGGAVVPEPVGRESDDAEASGGGAAVPKPADGAPEQEAAADVPPMPLPTPIGPSVPDGQMPAGFEGGPSGADALAMVGPLLAKANDATAGLLKEFTAGLPDRTPLDFATTDVAPEQAGQIVQREGGDVDRFTETVEEVGGPNPSMKQTPVLLRDQQTGFTPSTLFDVAGRDGGPSSLVDNQGAKYRDLEDYRHNNTLSDETQMVHPAELGKPAEGDAAEGDAGVEAGGGDAAELVSGPAHEVTFGERVGDFAKQIGGAAGAVGTSMLPGGGSDA